MAATALPSEPTGPVEIARPVPPPADEPVRLDLVVPDPEFVIRSAGVLDERSSAGRLLVVAAVWSGLFVGAGLSARPWRPAAGDAMSAATLAALLGFGLLSLVLLVAFPQELGRVWSDGARGSRVAGRLAMIGLAAGLVAVAVAFQMSDAPTRLAFDRVVGRYDAALEDYRSDPTTGSGVVVDGVAYSIAEAAGVVEFAATEKPIWGPAPDLVWVADGHWPRDRSKEPHTALGGGWFMLRSSS